MANISSTQQWHWETRALGLPRSLRGPTILQSKFWLCHIQLALIVNGCLCSCIKEVCKAQCRLCFTMLKNSSHQSCAGRLVRGSYAAWAASAFSVFSIELAHSIWYNNHIKPGTRTYFLGGAHGRAWYLWAEGKVGPQIKTVAGPPQDLASWTAAALFWATEERC